MSLTLKQLIDEALLVSGLPTETAYASSTDDAVKRLLSIANRSATKLGAYPYQALRDTHIFTLSSSDTQYDLPADWRGYLPDTAYGDSRTWGMDFPATKEKWAWLQSSTGGSGVRIKARILGDKIEVYQPNDAEEIRIEYWSSHPVLATDGTTTKERFSLDTDTFRLDDELIILDLTWRIKALHEFADWQIARGEFERYQLNYRGREAGAQTINPGEVLRAGEPYYDTWRPVPNA